MSNALLLHETLPFHGGVARLFLLLARRLPRDVEVARAVGDEQDRDAVVYQAETSECPRHDDAEKRRRREPGYLQEMYM